MQRQPYTYGQCTAATPSAFTVKFDQQRYPFPSPVPAYLLRVQSVMGFDPVSWRMAYAPTDIYTQDSPYKCTAGLRFFGGQSRISAPRKRMSSYFSI